MAHQANVLGFVIRTRKDASEAAKAIADEIMRTDIPGSTIPLKRAKFAAGVLTRELAKLIAKEED